MNNFRQKFWHWPGWRQFGYAQALGLAVTLWFILAYGGADWFAEQHCFRVRLHFGIDLAIPFVPGMTIFYLSLNALLACAPFILRRRRELEAFAISLAAATLVAAICFVALPGRAAFPVPSDAKLGAWAGIDHFARWLARTHNFLPSLHVAFTTIAVIVYRGRAMRLGRALLSGWGLAIVASTLFTHQHYLADVATGIFLGWLTVKWIYWPMSAAARRFPAGQTPAANRPTHQEQPA